MVLKNYVVRRIRLASGFIKEIMLFRECHSNMLVDIKKRGALRKNEDSHYEQNWMHSSLFAIFVFSSPSFRNKAVAIFWVIPIFLFLFFYFYFRFLN